MDIKQSTAKMVELAKKHPTISGAIILLVVFLGYIAYKRSGQSGDEDETMSDPAVSQDMGSGMFGGGGSGGGGVPDFTGGGDPAEVLGTGGGGGLENVFSGGGGGGGSSYVPDYSIPDVFTSYDVSPTYTPPANIPIESYVPATGMSGAVQAILPSANLATQSTIVKQVEKTASVAAQKPSPGVAKVNSQAPKSQPAPKKTESKPAKSSKGKTPAELVGKGKNFTGYYLGIYYVLGYPLLDAGTASSSVSTGGLGSSGQQQAAAWLAAHPTGMANTPKKEPKKTVPKPKNVVK